MKVIAPTSVRKYHDRPDNLKAVGAELGVHAILEGSVQRAGGRVHVAVQLIEATSERELWADTYDRSLDDVFTVQSEIAPAVANALHAILTPQESVALKRAPTENQKAYDLFLRGEHYLRVARENQSVADARKASGLYRQAINEDARFALAYARLSFAESYMEILDFLPSAVPPEQPRIDAEKALMLQPNLMEADLALAYYNFWGTRDYSTALEHLARAQARAPRDAEVLDALAQVYRHQLRFDDAVNAYLRGAEYDPGNSKLLFDLATTWWWAGHIDKVAPTLQRALMLDPNNENAVGMLADYLLVVRGDVEGAQRLLRGAGLQVQLSANYVLTHESTKGDSRARALPDDSGQVSGGLGETKSELLGLCLHSAGQDQRARPLLEAARARRMTALADKTLTPDHVPGTLFALAGLEAALGNRDAAVELAERGAQSDFCVREPIEGQYYRGELLEIYAQTGRNDKAIALLSEFLKAKSSLFSGITPVTLRFSSILDPLRGDPRFQALLKKYPIGSDAKVVRQ